MAFFRNFSFFVLFILEGVESYCQAFKSMGITNRTVIYSWRYNQTSRRSLDINGQIYRHEKDDYLWSSTYEKIGSLQGYFDPSNTPQKQANKSMLRGGMLFVTDGKYLSVFGVDSLENKKVYELGRFNLISFYNAVTEVVIEEISYILPGVYCLQTKSEMRILSLLDKIIGTKLAFNSSFPNGTIITDISMSNSNFSNQMRLCQNKEPLQLAFLNNSLICVVDEGIDFKTNQLNSIPTICRSIDPLKKRPIGKGDFPINESLICRAGPRTYPIAIEFDILTNSEIFHFEQEFAIKNMTEDSILGTLDSFREDFVAGYEYDTLELSDDSSEIFISRYDQGVSQNLQKDRMSGKWSLLETILPRLDLKMNRLRILNSTCILLEGGFYSDYCFSTDTGYLSYYTSHSESPIKFSKRSPQKYIYLNSTDKLYYIQKDKGEKLRSVLGNDTKDCYLPKPLHLDAAVDFFDLDNSAVVVNFGRYSNKNIYYWRIFAAFTNGTCYSTERNITTNFLPNSIKAEVFLINGDEFIFVFSSEKLEILKKENGRFDFSTASSMTTVFSYILQNVIQIEDTNLFLIEYGDSVRKIYLYKLENTTISLSSAKPISNGSSIKQVFSRKLGMAMQVWILQSTSLILIDNIIQENFIIKTSSSIIEEKAKALLMPIQGREDSIWLLEDSYKQSIIKPSDITTFERGCYICDLSCRECFGGRFDQCKTCEEGNTFFLNKENNDIGVFGGQCLSKCKYGTYRPENHTECLACHRSCKSCNSASEDDCIICADHYEMDLNRKCQFTCPTNKFYTNYTALECGLCHFSCERCTGPEESHCLECISGYDFFDGFCIPPCEGNTFRNLTNLKCDPCHQLCDGCKDTTPSGCLNCARKAQYNSLLGFCEPICELGTQSLAGKCIACPDNCARCKMNKCFECKENYIFNNESCICKTNGFFEIDNQCLKCDESCATCTGGSSRNCTICNPTLYRLSIKGEIRCLRECPDGFYKNSTLMNCESCHSTCSKCFGYSADKCTACKVSKLLYLNSCIDNCPPQTAISVNSFECIKCGENCNKCVNYSPSSCLECNSSFIYNSKCYSECPLGTASDDKIRCKTCPSGCSECNADFSCIECKRGFLMIEGTCLKNCPMGYIKDRVLGVCKKINCISNCRLCSNFFECSECESASSSGLKIISHKNQCYECKKENGLEMTSNGECQEVCGDSILFRLNTTKHECDVGNNVSSGTGCINCKLQRGFVCKRDDNNPLSNETCFESTKIKKFSESINSELNNPEYTLIFSNEIITTAKELSKKFELQYFEANHTEGSRPLYYLHLFAVKQGDAVFLLYPLDLYTINKELNGTLLLSAKSEESSIIDIYGLDVKISNAKTKILFKPHIIKDGINLERIIEFLTSTIQSPAFQIVIMLACSSPFISQMIFRTTQKFLYYRMLNIQTPKILMRAFSIFDFLMYTNIVKSGADKNNSNVSKQRSWIEIQLGVDLKERSGSPQIKALGISDLFIFSGFPPLLVIGIIYLVCLLFLVVQERLTGLFIHKKKNLELRLWRKKHRTIGSFIDFFLEKFAWNGILVSFFSLQQIIAIGVLMNIASQDYSTVPSAISIIIAYLSLVLILLLHLMIIAKIRGFKKQDEHQANIEKKFACLLQFDRDSTFGKYFVIVVYSIKVWGMIGVAIFVGQTSPMYALAAFLLLNVFEIIYVSFSRPGTSIAANLKIIFDSAFNLVINIGFLTLQFTSSDSMVTSTLGLTLLSLMILSLLLNIVMLRILPKECSLI